MKVIFKKCTIEDLDLLLEIAKATYFEGFAEAEATENLLSYVKNAFNLDKLQNEVNNPFSEFYLAMVDSKVCGYIKLNISTAQHAFIYENSVELERIYALKDQHGNGLGQELLNEAIKITRKKHASFIWLGVWEKNPRAIHFYQKNGFVKCGQQVFMMGQEKQIDRLMKLELD